jgi:hypothetical protein
MGSNRDSTSAVPDALPLTQWQKDELYLDDDYETT